MINHSFQNHLIQIDEEEMISSFETSSQNQLHIKYKREKHPSFNTTRQAKRKQLSKPIHSHYSFRRLTDIKELQDSVYCGQAFSSFLLFALSNTLFIIDQV